MVRRTVLDSAPVELRCALDGRLMVDPVRAPDGRCYDMGALRAAGDSDF